MKLARAAAIALFAAALLLGGLPLRASGPVAVAGDGTCGEARIEAAPNWFFAEGYTGDGFQEYLCLFNPGEAWSQLDLDLLYNAGPAQRVEVDLPPRSRVTLDINSLAGSGKELSLSLQASEPIVAERPMYFVYRGRWKGCTVTSGTTALADTWYFAEGCTRPGFETWVLLANPGDAAIPVTVYFILDDGSVTPYTLTLPPHTRQTVYTNLVVGEGHDVGARVQADAPICAERVMYFDYHDKWPGGHASSGLSQARDSYLFAEGYTGAGFEEWLCLYLPRESGGADGTDVTLNCLYEGGAEQSFPLHLDPDRRHTININQLVGGGRNVSMELRASEPFLAERPMYFNYNSVCRGGHVSKGVDGPDTHWLLAEGTTRGGFYEYLCIMNPGDEDATVEVDYVITGQDSRTRELIVPARSRSTINVREQEGRDLDTSFEIASDHPIAVERPLYFPGWSFEVANAMDNLWNLSVGIGQRVEGTQGELDAANYIKSVLESYGYSPIIQEVPLPNGSSTRNVIARFFPPQLPTLATHDLGTLVVGGHYDTKIGTGSPGANDNGSGTVVVLELARCIAEEPVNFPVEFVLFGGEERLTDNPDLHHFGSRYYVNNMSQQAKDNTYGAIIVDMVGVGSQLYARTMGIGPMDLCNSLLAFAANTGVYLPYMVSGSYSDHEPFENAGIPAVWLEYKDDPWYHTAADSYDKINPAYIDHTGRLLENFIRSL